MLAVSELEHVGSFSSFLLVPDKAIMGDEIFPDEVMEIRVQMTKRYQEPSGILLLQKMGF